MHFPTPEVAPRFVEFDTAAVRVENAREFGGPWLAWQLIRRLGLDEFLRKTIAVGDDVAQRRAAGETLGPVTPWKWHRNARD